MVLPTSVWTARCVLSVSHSCCSSGGGGARRPKRGASLLTACTRMPIHAQQSFRFINGKNEACFHMKRNPRKINWTLFYRRLRKKGTQVQNLFSPCLSSPASLPRPAPGTPPGRTGPCDIGQDGGCTRIWQAMQMVANTRNRRIHEHRCFPASLQHTNAFSAERWTLDCRHVNTCNIWCLFSIAAAYSRLAACAGHALAPTPHSPLPLPHMLPLPHGRVYVCIYMRRFCMHKGGYRCCCRVVGLVWGRWSVYGEGARASLQITRHLGSRGQFRRYYKYRDTVTRPFPRVHQL